MAIELNPYLFFAGNADQAIAFYQQVFGGEVSITRRGDVDPSATAEERNQVVNALLNGGDVTIRASDYAESTDEQNRVELSLIGKDEARLRALFAALAQGGTVRANLEKQFWGDVFGAVTDKYGIRWQINIGSAGA
ncbi:MAG: VOC family protein [Actinobacteria bacterium]|nr:VOC family protein [Actinomycetota bacterium]MBO0836250.1 VOC family protein [Actinomycetota bacterium]